jgi:hypothetical protein
VFILQRYPPADRILTPVEFPQVMAKVKSFCGKNSPSTVESWIKWSADVKIPQTQSVIEHIEKHPNSFYIPLHEKLFSNLSISTENIESSNEYCFNLSA